MKKNHVTILIGFLFLFLFKRTLLPIDSHPIYLLTNIIGTLFMLLGWGKSNYVALSYCGLNSIVYFLSIFEGLSTRLPLFFYSLPFVAGVVVLTHILCVIGVLLLLVYSIKLSKGKYVNEKHMRNMNCPLSRSQRAVHSERSYLFNCLLFT